MEYDNEIGCKMFPLVYREKHVVKVIFNEINEISVLIRSLIFSPYLLEPTDLLFHTIGEKFLRMVN